MSLFCLRFDATTGFEVLESVVCSSPEDPVLFPTKVGRAKQDKGQNRLSNLEKDAWQCGEIEPSAVYDSVEDVQAEGSATDIREPGDAVRVKGCKGGEDGEPQQHAK